MSVFKKCFIVFFSFLLYSTANAQERTIPYILEVKGLTTKTLIKEFDSIVSTNTNIKVLKGYGFPRTYYFIKSIKELTTDDFTRLLPSKFIIVGLKKSNLTDKELETMKAPSSKEGSTRFKN